MPGVSRERDLTAPLEVLDAEDAVARGLGLVGGDGELDTQDLIHQSGFAHVGLAHDRGKPAPQAILRTFFTLHLGSFVVCTHLATSSPV